MRTYTCHHTESVTSHRSEWQTRLQCPVLSRDTLPCLCSAPEFSILLLRAVGEVRQVVTPCTLSMSYCTHAQISRGHPVQRRVHGRPKASVATRPLTRNEQPRNWSSRHSKNSTFCPRFVRVSYGSGLQAPTRTSMYSANDSAGANPRVARHPCVDINMNVLAATCSRVSCMPDI